MQATARPELPARLFAPADIRRESGYAPSRPAVYYDILTPHPATGQPPVIMVHGGSHSGTCFLHTADGRPGWAQALAGFGYPVVVPDWPGQGRSGDMDVAHLTGETVCAALGALIESLGSPVVLLTHSMSGAYGWKLIETHGDHIAALVAVAPAPPGNLQPVPETVARNPDEIVVQTETLERRVPLKAPALATRDFAKVKLVGASSQFPAGTLDDYVATLKHTPARLAYERRNIDGSQLTVADTAPFRGKPILMVCATDDIDHTRQIDGRIAGWLAEIGATIDFWYLGDMGIAGNGHMMMLEANSDEIAAIIAAWLETHASIRA